MTRGGPLDSTLSAAYYTQIAARRESIRELDGDGDPLTRLQALALRSTFCRRRNEFVDIDVLGVGDHEAKARLRQLRPHVEHRPDPDRLSLLDVCHAGAFGILQPGVE